MSDPWLTIIGLGEDGPNGLPPASLKALEEADYVMGAVRHLSLLPDLIANQIIWPTPFADGIPVLLGLRGQKVVMLASGDPFWYGAGTSVTKHLEAGEWRTLTAPSTFNLAVAHLGWAMEATQTIALHAAPFSRLRPLLYPDAQVICTLRDGDAVTDLANWLYEAGFGDSTIHIMEALGGPRERVRSATVKGYKLTDVQHPVVVGIQASGPALPMASGHPDTLFDHDGQITK